jgi:microcystin-dependent protein
MGKSMIKRAILALLLMAAATCAQAAGTVAFSLSQQLDQYGKPLSGCLLYTIQAGTTSTPQNSFKDTALTLVQPNPLVCDAFGRLPQFFLADGQIKIRLTDKLGNAVLTQDNILVIGPSSGGGGGGSVDPTTIAATGDVKSAYGTQTITGWVRLNGRTIGSATSGATERANADAQALFQYLWTTDSALAVSGGRGASSLADWTANKTIALPDFRGRVLAGLDDMGGTDSTRMSGGSLAGCRTTLGCAGGEATHTPIISEMVPHNHSTTVIDPGHTHGTNLSGPVYQQVGGVVIGGSANTALSPTGLTITSATTGISVTVNSNGNGVAFNQVQPTILGTFYIKL